MNLSYKELLPAHFPANSRVWIYQSSRQFTIAEALQIEEILENFSKEWKSHGDPVENAAFLFFGRFIIVLANEASVKVGGCSTDASVRFIKEIEKAYNVSLFDRTSLAFVIKDKIELLPLSQLEYAYSNNFIDLNTLYFNNTVLTKQELEENWIIPVNKSWLAKSVSTVLS
jgi:hypothetical protein